ncbi:MAG TPA: hypothetical protein VKW06_02455 [Candidatus Angelobacter sp.]|nr:hypothetical protein [Candidatus Angelobacter sp.]
MALTAAIASSGTADTRASTKPAAASQQERDDYRTAAAATSGAALDKSAHEFSAKYPQSALRVYLFEKALRQYQIENDSVGVQDAAKAVLTISPDDPLALVLTATTLADELSALEADRDKKVSEIRRSADLAIHNLDRGVLPAAAAPQQAPLYRTTLQAMAYSALGIMKLKTGDDSGAEKDLKTAVELAKARPDPSIWYHLALAQEHRKKYSAAINSVEQAMQLASGNPQLQHLAEMEHDRLWRLAGRNKDSSDSSNNPSPK